MDKLVKQQACQLFIEQEIEKGLAEGKTKYAIGHEIAAWIKKLFEADVKPNTIQVRAARMEKEIVTNVTTESTPPNQTEFPEKSEEEIVEGPIEGPKDAVDEAMERPIPPRVYIESERLRDIKSQKAK